MTSPSRTCLDLARWAEPDRLTDALRLRKVDEEQLRQSLDRSRGHRGQAPARSALEVRSTPWSEPERVAHRALHDAGVTGWVANPRIRTAGGGRFPDVAYHEVEPAVEIGGREAYDGRGAFDRVRHNEFVHAGRVVLPSTAATVLRDPQRVVTEVVGALTRLRGRDSGASE